MGVRGGSRWWLSYRCAAFKQVSAMRIVMWPKKRDKGRYADWCAWGKALVALCCCAAFKQASGATQLKGVRGIRHVPAA